MDPQEISKLKTTGYVILTMEILEDKTLSMAEKFVLARITGFDKAGGHYESVENTAAALGLSKRMVQYARKHLEELGYIEIVGYSELGTKLIKVKSLHPEPVQNLHRGAIASPEKGDAKSAPGCKIVAKGVQPLRPILKGEERLSSKDKSFEEAHEPEIDSEDSSLKDEEPKRYGSAEINEFLDQWQEATGFDWHGVRQERFAAKNLIAKYGSEAIQALLRRVKAARRSTDQFAPQIAKPSQLVGKYEKLTALTMWEERQQKAQQPQPTTSRPVIEGPQVPRGPVYERDVREDKTEEELRAECQSIREKFKGTKYEHLFNGGRK